MKVEDPIWEGDRVFAGQEITPFYETLRFITVFKKPATGSYCEPDEFIPTFCFM
jgi:hypothetical protein